MLNSFPPSTMSLLPESSRHLCLPVERNVPDPAFLAHLGKYVFCLMVLISHQTPKATYLNPIHPKRRAVDCPKMLAR